MSAQRNTRSIIAVAASAVIVALTLSLSAVASLAATTGNNCAATPPLRGQTAEPTVYCFVTFGEAIMFATNGKVHLSSALAAREVAPSELEGATAATASPDTSYVLSIDYKDANFGGSSFTWYGASPCGSYTAASMPAGWNDSISSVATYSGCAVTLYYNGNFGAPTYPIHVNASVASLGTFNDKTSSEKWCSSYPCS
jgi:hypothetical protein